VLLVLGTLPSGGVVSRTDAAGKLSMPAIFGMYDGGGNSIFIGWHVVPTCVGLQAACMPLQQLEHCMLEQEDQKGCSAPVQALGRFCGAACS
jgi:hypothetical protein